MTSKEKAEIIAKINKGFVSAIAGIKDAGINNPDMDPKLKLSLMRIRDRMQNKVKNNK